MFSLIAMALAGPPQRPIIEQPEDFPEPTRSGSLLTPEGGWADGDSVQLIPEELRLEDVMRVWDALEPSYRLSACYVARVVPVDTYRPPAPPRGRPPPRAAGEARGLLPLRNSRRPAGSPHRSPR